MSRRDGIRGTGIGYYKEPKGLKWLVEQLTNEELGPAPLWLHLVAAVAVALLIIAAGTIFGLVIVG
jgi:hypothetical protein